MRNSSFSRAALFATAAVQLLGASAAQGRERAADGIADLMLGVRGPRGQPNVAGQAIADFLVRGGAIRVARVGPPPVTDRAAASRSTPAFRSAAATPARGPDGVARLIRAADVQPLPDAQPRREGGPAPNFPAPDPQTLLLLLVQLDNLTLTEGMAAYGAPDDPQLPLGELSRLLELDVDVSPSEGRVTGRIGEARRALTIDLATNTARIGPLQVPLARGDVTVDPSDIYVRASILAQLLPLKFSVDSRALQMKLTGTELLPIQGRLQRLARLRQVTTNPTAREVMRVETPYKLFTPPAFDVALGLGAQTVDPKSQTRYDIRMGGDLLYADLQAYVGSDDAGRANTARVLLEKRSLDGNLLGPLHARMVGLGDVFTPGLSIGPRSLGGRGVVVSSVPLDQTSVFNRVDLRGELPLGDDVELYVNDVLQAAQQTAVNGRYEFLNVPLTQGVNVVRIVKYGPRGERTEETRIINASGGLLRPGQVTFEFGASDQNQPLFKVGNFDPGLTDRSFGRSRVVANVNYGITQYLTAGLGAAVYSDALGVERRLYTGSLRTSIDGFATQLDMAGDDRGGQGASIDVAGRILGANTLIRHSEYRGGLLDENNPEADLDRPLTRRTEVTVDDNLRFGRQLVPVTVRAIRDVYADGGDTWIGQVRGTTSVGRVLYSSGFEYDRNTTAAGQVNEILRGSLGVSTFRKYQWQVRGTLNYDIVPDVRPSDLEILLDRTLSNTWSLRFGVTERLDTSRGTELLAGSTTRTKFGDLTLTGQYLTSDRSWRFAAQMNFGLGYNPQTGYQLTRSGPGSGGSVAFHAFVDANGNGQFDPGERPVAKVALEGGELRAKTDADGRAFLSGFGAGPTARVLVNIAEIDNQQVKTPPAVVEFSPRPGGVTTIEYPMRPTGEVMVNVRLRRPGQPPVGLSATHIRLVDDKGKAFEGITEFDGSVNFQEIPAATYRVELDKDQAARLRMRLTAPVSVTIKSDGSITPDVTAEVLFEPRADAEPRPPG